MILSKIYEPKTGSKNNVKMTIRIAISIIIVLISSTLAYANKPNLTEDEV